MENPEQNRNASAGRKSRQMKGKNRRDYELSSLRAAVLKVKNDNWSIYKASKEYGIPWTTLKTHVSNENEDPSSISIPKLGRPFTFPKDIECKLVSYIIKMQEIGFGLSVTDIKRVGYALAVKTGQLHQFNDAKGKAGAYWWWSLKQRYGLSLRTPEKLAACRAVTANRENLNDFYEKLLTVLTKLNLIDKPERIYNCDETGVTFVVKPSRIVTKMGKKIIYSRTFAEKGVTQTVLGCCSASGSAVPPLIIFKGVRMVNNLCNGAPTNSLVRLSKNGWINSTLFLEWLQHFVAQIPPARPVLLIMDSHASHVGIEVIDFAKTNDIHLLTFPSHTSHLLQPLDVSVYKSLKNAWSKVMDDYKCSNPTSAPTRLDFCRLLTPAYEHAFQPSIIINGFRKAGIFPLNRDAISDESIAPSLIRPALATSGVSTQEIQTSTTGECGAFENDIVANLLSLPQIPTSPATRAARRDLRSRYLTPINDNMYDDPISEPVNVATAELVTILQPIADEYLSNANEPTPGQSHNKRISTRSSDKTIEAEVTSALQNEFVTNLLSMPEISESMNVALAEPERQLLAVQSLLNEEQPCPGPSQNKRRSERSSRKYKRPYSQKSAKCDLCGGYYSQDVAHKNGAVWLECMECAKWYHQECVNCYSPQFLCENCDVGDYSADDDDEWAPE